MATINGFTAAHMQAIKNGTISSAALGGASGYDLVFTKYDSTTLNVGNVRGATGPTGATGATGPAGTNGTGLIVCTSSTRPASPSVGQNIYETDTGRHLVYYGATTLWRQPWNMPWGVISWFTNTAQPLDVTSTTGVVLSGVTGTVGIISNRVYELTFSCRYLNSAVDTVNNFIIRRAGTSVLGGISRNQSTVSDQTFTLSGLYQTGSGGSSTWDVFCYNSSGTTRIYGGNATTQLIIKDVGPLTSTVPAS